jgi:hypothetical protein
LLREDDVADGNNVEEEVCVGGPFFGRDELNVASVSNIHLLILPNSGINDNEDVLVAFGGGETSSTGAIVAVGDDR